MDELEEALSLLELQKIHSNKWMLIAVRIIITEQSWISGYTNGKWVGGWISINCFKKIQKEIFWYFFEVWWDPSQHFFSNVGLPPRTALPGLEGTNMTQGIWRHSEGFTMQEFEKGNLLMVVGWSIWNLKPTLHPWSQELSAYPHISIFLCDHMRNIQYLIQQKVGLKHT